MLKTEAGVCLFVCQWVCETHQQLRHFLTSQKCFLLRNLDPAGQFLFFKGNLLYFKHQSIFFLNEICFI